MAKDESDLQYIDKLFILTEDNEEILAPVVTLSNEPYNIYGLLEQRFSTPNGLPPPDHFFRVARSLSDPPLETWRPRVNGVQLKVLQGARFPRHDHEWAALGRALAASSQLFRPGVYADTLLSEIKTFTAGVELWWDDRKRKSNEPNSGPIIGNNNDINNIINSNNKRGFTTQLVGGPPAKQMNNQSRHPSQLDLTNIPTNAAAAASNQYQQQNPITNNNNNNNTSPDTCITLNVGGDKFTTTFKTLAAVETSFFYRIARQQPLPNDVFIDRNGKLFCYCLDYLRCRRFGEDYLDLPRDTHTLKLLRREATFYRLSGLMDEVDKLLIGS